MRKLFAVVIATTLAVGCAGRTSQVYVTADTTVVDILSQFKAEKDVRCDAGEIPASTCQAVAKAFVPVWEAYLNANALITAEAPLTEVDAAVVKFKASATKFKDALGEIRADYRKILLDLLEQALRRFDR